MAEPGYYKTNYRAISIRELVRLRGWMKLPFAFYWTRFGSHPPSGQWLPMLSANEECKAEDLPEKFWSATTAQRQALEELGFVAQIHVRRNKDLDPVILDACSIQYLHAEHPYPVNLAYVRTRSPAPLNREKEIAVTAFCAIFQDGSAMVCSNGREFLDPNPKCQVLKFPILKDPRDIHTIFIAQLKEETKPLRRFSGRDELRAWSDTESQELLDRWVARGFKVRMTDEEIRHAQQRMRIEAAKRI